MGVRADSVGMGNHLSWTALEPQTEQGYRMRKAQQVLGDLCLSLMAQLENHVVVESRQSRAG